ncbi:hypothetical protein [Catellatospora sp. IY07-71]|uniref:hypothetical protein n=1 Tax=Catellatospora sp. IY07-71 TaxID=2728827 RepID=UPI001BB410DD|nr:hypothetical protein [Catellatospora sp. IY07-71]
MRKTGAVRTRADDHSGPGGFRPNRRGLLRAGTAAAVAGVAAPALAGCDLFGGPDEPPPPDALTGLLAGTHALVASYDAALAADTTLTALLTPLRDTHKAHAAALEAIMSPKPSPSAFSLPSAAPVDGDRKAILAALRTGEASAAKQAAEACVSTTTARAVLVGEIAAARATHVEVLA